MIQACADVGSQSHAMSLLAGAIQATSKPTGNCFNCKRPGHFAKQCRAPGGGAHKDGAASKAKPSDFAIDLINQETKDSVLPGEIVLMPTQLAGPLPPKVAGLILPKFSAVKEGIQVIPGVLDPDYVGTIMGHLGSHMPMQLKRLLAVVQRIGEKKLLQKYKINGVPGLAVRNRMNINSLAKALNFTSQALHLLNKEQSGPL
ncbi:retrovirus group K member 9 Gag polyproteinpolyprotein-like-like [Podarcis lilfordi]|uniref:Retrovirus group K member 9 Gag polyproteinpolyprotein-like-like n=1 Tax=Podarcis lilfordi TaxID=74358 RepID=A0AA35P991_9SAUR|nr:retrovirus group K member 9 Gag polyproteinpolyprotein-like-like [Podarcis lilfordi]